MRSRLRLRLVLVAALLAGAAARLVLAFLRPLWADEIFTLTLARQSLPDLLAALRLDSGPPLHYLAAKLLLLPFAAPGPVDVAVRLLSVVASLLHVPLLLRIGRRCGAPRAGVVAAALFLVFPLAAASGAEGRGYALASLLALAAFERLLALEEAPRVTTAVLAGLLGGAAVLTHYLALLPVAGMLLAALVRGRSRRLAFLASGLAAALAASWLPVALGQPRASMAWAEAQPLGERALQFAANLGLGLPVEPGPARLLGPLALVLLAAAFLGRRGRRARPGGGASPRRSRPPRPAPPLQPIGSSPRPDGARLPPVRRPRPRRGAEPSYPRRRARRRRPSSRRRCRAGCARRPRPQLAATLAPRVRAGARVVAAELWGPELDYRLAREGLPGRVTLVPVGGRAPSRLVRGVRGVRSRGSRPRPSAVVGAAGARTFFVLSPATRAGRVLVGRARRGGRGPRRGGRRLRGLDARRRREAPGTPSRHGRSRGEGAPRRSRASRARGTRATGCGPSCTWRRSRRSAPG